MQSLEGVYWGFSNDCCTGGDPTLMSTINGLTGKRASTYDLLVIKRFNAVLTANSYGYYSQITELPYTGQQFNSIKEDIVQSGAVFIPAIQPTDVKFSDITPSVANQIAGVLEQFTSQGVEVWLRFAHEMNWYARQGHFYAGGSGYHQSRAPRRV